MWTISDSLCNGPKETGAQDCSPLGQSHLVGAVIYWRWHHLALIFSVCVKERQDVLVSKLHKRQYKARFIANSSSCTTTERSK